MSSPRDAFLQRVHQAVAAGNRPGESADIRARGRIGEQDAGSDSAAEFCSQVAAVGGSAYRVSGDAEATSTVLELVRATKCRRILIGTEPILERLGVGQQLTMLGREVTSVGSLPAGDCRETFFAAEVGITGVDYVIAESGTLVVAARPTAPRSISLLPPFHIAIADRAQILPDLFDLFRETGWRADGVLPSCLSLITGPSKTGDIELRLVTGVHGPEEVHVILIDP